MKSLLRRAPLLLALLLPSPSPAQVQNNGAVVCAELNWQVNPRAVSDGAGGILVAWQDYRSNTSYDIYVQRLNASGTPMWTQGGVVVCSSTGTQQNPVLVSDGAGGAIIVWEDARIGAWDIYAQRVGGAGTIQWTFNGVPVCTIPGDQTAPAITTDGSGGAIIAWQDFRSSNLDIFSQRLSNAGVAQWTNDGVAVCTAGGYQQFPVIVSDGAGGALLAWQDPRNGPYDIYGQHLNASGGPQWTANGLAYCAAVNDQTSPSIAGDGSGGAIVTWQDQRSGSGRNAVYAQRFNAIGVPIWTVDGVAVCTTPAGTSSPRLAPTGGGAAIFAWQDQRNGNSDIYAQEVGASGVPQWTGDGVAVCTVGGDQNGPAIVADGAGGAMISFYDNRFSAGNDVYLQHLNGTGVRALPAEGLTVCSAPGDQLSPGVVPDGTGGVEIVWQDGRYYGTTLYDVFAQRITADGTLVYPDAEYPRLVSVRDVPNDQGGHVKLSWTASNQDLAPFSIVASYWIWRSAPPGAVTRALRAGARFTDSPQQASKGTAFLRMLAGAATYYWEYVAAQPAGHFPAYSYVAATTSDSMPGSNPLTAFMIQARNSDGTKWWNSNPDSGYSVDNLPPASVSALSGQYAAGATALHWRASTESDLAAYRLYRGTSPGFPTDASHLIASVEDTGYVDTPGAPYLYKLTATDVHGNESSPDLIQPSGTASVADNGAEYFLKVANPLHAGDVIQFVAPRNSRVHLDVVDPLGRRLELASQDLPAGMGKTRWPRLPPGLYFIRLRSGGVVRVARVTTFN
jgi:hypothetical protein